ncbi:MAG: glycosyltransferase [Patescibacteria group bacterium]
MKIALVHDFLNQLGGAERVLTVLHQMYPTAPVYTLLYDPEKTRGFFSSWDIRPSYLQKWPNFLKKRQKYLLPFYSTAIESFDLSEYDLVISSSNSFAKGVITGPDTLHVSYCHSPMRYAWDWHAEYLNENKLNWFSKKIVKKIIHQIRIWDKESAKRVDFWIANSNNVKQRIKKYYHQDSEVLFPPVNSSNFKIEENPSDYFLIVSRLSAYKKVELAVKTFNELGYHLVVVGTGEQYNMLKSIAKPNVEIVGFKSDKVVQEYMSNCRAFVHPLEEDAGITPLEAMASGRPVIAYHKGGSLESVQEGINGVFFNEPTVDSLIEGIKKFEEAESRFDPQKIQESVSQFDNSKFKEKLEKIIKEKIKL